MGIHQWGKTVAGALLTAAVITAVSGCGGEADADAKKPPAKAQALSVDKATTSFHDAVTKFDLEDGCPKEAGACWKQMTAVIEPARDLRKAMNADKATGPEFWSEAYALIDTMETGMAVGEDQFSNRPDVLGSAHHLSD
ncbi:hypothetical protein [Streptomyces sp. LN590]|uniref:hypothetical protein n=1 Tax=unclassified Streptomyces TaxID=2593676 RepID=UPI00371DF64F